LNLAGRSREELHVCVTERTPSAHLAVLDRLRISYERVPVFDIRHPHSNKLAQLNSIKLSQADWVVLCDCDIAFSQGIVGWFEGQHIRAKVVDRAVPSVQDWQTIMLKCGFSAEIPLALATTTLEPTYLNNCNGGLYIIPRVKFPKIREKWFFWVQYFLDQPEILTRHTYFTDQIAFAVAMRDLNDYVDMLGMQYNFPTHLDSPITNGFPWIPQILHYHKLFDLKAGVYPTYRNPRIDSSIRRVNHMLSQCLPDFFDILPSL
jgi:hypothetical protein